MAVHRKKRKWRPIEAYYLSEYLTENLPNSSEFGIEVPLGPCPKQPEPPTLHQTDAEKKSLALDWLLHGEPIGPPLTHPYNKLRLPDGAYLNLRIKDWDLGTITINLRNGRGITAMALRLHLKEGCKRDFPYYYDVTAKKLIARILPMLQKLDYRLYEILVHKLGTGPTSEHSIWVKQLTAEHP